LAAAAAAAATGGSSGAGAEPPGAGQPPPPPPLLMDVNRHLEGAPAAVVDSLAVLEWPAVCRQVACFCGTPMGAELLAGGGLPLGGSAAESEALLQETEEAGAAGLAVAGVFDLRPALAAVALGGCLNAKQLEGVAVSLEASFAASDAARAADGAGRPRFPSLAAAAAGDVERARAAAVLDAIRTCVQARRSSFLVSIQYSAALPHRLPLRLPRPPSLLNTPRAVPSRPPLRRRPQSGSVADGASDALRDTRQKRRANLQALRDGATQWARTLAAQGASDTREPALMRGRCVPARSAVAPSRRFRHQPVCPILPAAPPESFLLGTF